jgi:predicted nucleotidyltransferase component of viral defense system
MAGYEIRELGSQYPYSPAVLEKVCRISDLVAQVSMIPLLREHLSLYGGTAINFVHLKPPRRLSVDVDFNYRHLSEPRDWGKVRREIDAVLKQILHDQGYLDDDIKIDPSYPISRFHVEYVNHLGVGDSFKIETGYMRRIPLLKDDAYKGFMHIGRDMEYIVKTPRSEELYANKMVTLLSRATPRDLYDAYTIAKAQVDEHLIRGCLVLESFTCLRKPLTDLDIRGIINGIRINDSLRMVLEADLRPHIQEVRESATARLEGLVDGFTDGERRCIDEFYGERRFNPRLLQLDVHPEIERHPAIIRALQT